MRIGTAGWTIPAVSRAQFALEGSQLERYALQMNCVEINSSFHRSHRQSVYARWAASVPEDFAFAVKIPKAITHMRRCVDCHEEFARFLDESSGLGSKRSVLLVQLPPSFAYDDVTVGRFLQMLRGQYEGFAVCEPRHSSWFTPAADPTLRDHRVGRVASDPARCEGAEWPGGWRGIAYYRWHGSPRMYYSRYETGAIAQLASRLKDEAASERWCIFDNTAGGMALENARELQRAAGTGGNANFPPNRAFV
ncbi:MAG: DUF72 domain-containing protein [Candidatus Baltobacteraceae bacterium]